ncbi:MAG: DUF885 domain-containing protein [Sphingomonadales bacterium]|nr:DUF885 domain-containing protein [Sphingomonadales bacterium]
MAHAIAGLSRRRFLAGLATASAGLTRAGPALALAPAEQQLAGLMGKLWDEQQRRFPETIAPLGAAPLPQPRAAGRLDPWSRAAREDWVGWARSAVRRIEALDAAALPQAALTDRAVMLDHFGKIARLGTRYRFGASASDPGAPVAPFAISPVTGPHRALARLLGPGLGGAGRSGAGGEAGDIWFEQLASLPRALDAATEAFRSDVGAGIVPPASVLEATLAELAGVRVIGAATRPGLERLAGAVGTPGASGDWSGRVAALLARDIYPALERQQAAIDAARGHGAAGLWAEREGEAFYADALAWHTGSAISAQDAHALGRAQVADLSAELDGLLVGLGLASGPVAERLAALAVQGAPAYADDQAGRAAVLTDFAAALDRWRGQLPLLFGMSPAVPRAVSALPGTAATGEATAFVEPGSGGGGTLYVDLQRPSAWSPGAVAAAAFFEGVPAPLWDAAATFDGVTAPAIRLHGTRYAAHAEGWALYAGQVLDEQGLLARDPLSRIAFLRRRLGHAARLVADTGLHAQRWTPAEAAAYLVATTGGGAAAQSREVARMAAAPGQACAAAVGQAEWLRLRALARCVAGARFDQRAFHTVLRHGRAPFAVLEEVVVMRFTPRRSERDMRTV